MARRSKEDAEKTRTAILEAAECLFAQKSVRGTSLEQIAQKAGVTRGAIYWHFKDKTDLLIALRDSYRPPEVEIFVAALEAGVADVLQVILDTVPMILTAFVGSESRQRMYQIIEQDLLENQRGADIEGYAMTVRMMQHAADQGQLADDLTPEEAGLAMIVLIKGLMTEWLITNRAFDLAEMGRRMLARHIRSIRR